ncbi:hypothetical protein [Leptospira licerasiae]|uniref:hypothetical protein n=1 Tax=Leptospira licerasiae TaxID=447106 RepID=UPI00301B10DD
MKTKFCTSKIRFRFILLFLIFVFSLPSCGVYLLLDDENGYFAEEKKDHFDKMGLLGLLQANNNSVPIVFSSNEFSTPTWGPASYSISIGSVPSSWPEQNFQFNVFVQVTCNNVVVTSINEIQGTSSAAQTFSSPDYSAIQMQINGNTADADCKSSGYCDITHIVHNPIPQLLSQGQYLGTVRAHFPATCSF